MGGTVNHVHMLVSMSKNVALNRLLMDVKKDSSKWIKTHGRQYAGFHWQDGYGAFTIGESQVEDLKRYIARQKEKHATATFEEELVAFLNKYGVTYDPQYIWT